MTKTIRTQPNQSLLDIILTEYGTLEAGMEVAFANNIDISNLSIPGSSKDMPRVAPAVVNVQEADYIRRNSIVIGTSAPEILEATIALKPRMHIAPNAVGDPHALGYYSYDLVEAAGFIHTSPLDSSYLSNNLVHYQTEERYIFADPDETSLPVIATPMPGISIPYKLLWSVGLGYMIVWSDLAQPIITVTFRDIEGNKAYSAPVTVLDNASMDVIEHFMGDITVDFLSASPASVSVRLTRSHPPIALANFSNHAMEWLEEASSGTPDPSDPSNPDKTMLTLGAGAHSVGLKTTYYFPGGIPAYPSSAFTMIIKVA